MIMQWRQERNNVKERRIEGGGMALSLLRRRREQKQWKNRKKRIWRRRGKMPAWATYDDHSDRHLRLERRKKKKSKRKALTHQSGSTAPQVPSCAPAAWAHVHDEVWNTQEGLWHCLGRAPHAKFAQTAWRMERRRNINRENKIIA